MSRNVPATPLLVAVVEDDDSVRKALGRLLGSFGMNVETFASAGEFLRALHEHRPDCLVLDVRMPEMSGLQLQAHLASLGCRLPIIFISASGTAAEQGNGSQMGATAFLHKPFGDRELLVAIRRATRNDGHPSCSISPAHRPAAPDLAA